MGNSISVYALGNDEYTAARDLVKKVHAAGYNVVSCNIADRSVFIMRDNYISQHKIVFSKFVRPDYFFYQASLEYVTGEPDCITNGSKCVLGVICFFLYCCYAYIFLLLISMNKFIKNKNTYE